MLQQRNATVTTYHSKTPEIMRATDMPFYDMFFFCVGKAKEYNRIDIFPLPICDNEEKVVIDVGINFDENGKLCGDFDPASCEETDRVHYSPVPGGIGLMTRAILMEHVLRAAYMMGEFKGLWTELKDSQN